MSKPKLLHSMKLERLIDLINGRPAVASRAARRAYDLDRRRGKSERAAHFAAIAAMRSGQN
jgi:hypothetical protein